MASDLSPIYETAALLDDDQDILSVATCPMCHTSAMVPQRALEAGGAWRCVRCGQHWDPARLATVAAYAAWAVDHDPVNRRGTESSPEIARIGSVPTEGLAGRP